MPAGIGMQQIGFQPRTSASPAAVAPRSCVQRWRRAANRTYVRASAASSSSSASPAAATQQQEQQQQQGRTTFHHGITYTAYGGNSFHVKFNTTGVRVLVDPWLVGPLEFFEAGWLYRGTKTSGLGAGVAIDVAGVAAETDVILITQWVDDHTHMPTLSRLPRNIPIIAQPEAADRIRPLGYTQLTTISPGQTMDLAGGKLRLRATEGALVGPPWSQRQNGYVLQEQAGSSSNGSSSGSSPTSLYYEPHCDFVERSLAGVGRVDVVVSPVKSVLLGGYPLVKGDTELVKLLRLLRPKVLVPLLNADLDQEGGLVPLMSTSGSSKQEDVEAMLGRNGLGDVKVDYPAPPGESLAIAL